MLESVCTIVNAVIIGYMTAYMDELNKKSAELSAKINLTNTAMINLKLSRPLKNEISKYIYNTHTTKNLQNEMQSFLEPEKMKSSLRVKITTSSFIGVVDQNYVLKLIMQERCNQIFSISQNLQKTIMGSERRSFKDKLIGKLVNHFTNVFTIPDGVYLQQNDEP